MHHQKLSPIERHDLRIRTRTIYETIKGKLESGLGAFWADYIKTLRDDPAARLEIARQYQPLPAAFEEAAIALRAMIHDRREQRADFKDLLNLAQAEIELDEWGLKCDRLRQEAEAIALAHQELTAAVKEYQESHRERLAEAATGYFADLTGVPGRRVILDDGFKLSVLEQDGHSCALKQLS